MTLRAKLLLTVLSLVAIALVVSDVAASANLRSYLLRQTDNQLTAARAPVARRVFTATTTTTVPGAATTTTTADPNNPGPPPEGNNNNRPGFISDFFIQVRNPAGVVTSQFTPTVRGDQDPLPALDTTIVNAHVGKKAFSVGAVGNKHFMYRAIVTRATNGDVFVAAVSMQSVDNTINRLEVTELVVSIAVLLVLAGAAWWIVRVELRQLDKIADTAGAIAAGDLSRRVDVGRPRTEVGRLSESLNSMLSQIEASFTERQMSEERLRRFATDASHELRTPLTAVRGYAELFRQGAIQDDEHLNRVMKRIESEAARMGLMVDDLLLLARLDQGRPLENEAIDVVQVVANVVHDSQVVSDDRTVILESNAARSVVEGDAARLHQIFSNLVGNALTHTPAGTDVKLTVSSTDTEVIVDVADNGPGLPPGSAERVFERFYRVDAGRSRNTGGTGLGLAIVKSLVDAHGGQVSVTSKDGEGACFSVRLPLVGTEITD